jgi:type III restriction enzyme
MPKKGRGKGGTLDPLAIPVELQTALEALYGHYEKTYQLWEQEKIAVPPCFIVVCQNTAISKLIYDFISGFVREDDDGTGHLVDGRLKLFRNFDEHGNPLARPRTLLIDSEQLESGDALDNKFRDMASDEIERFRREIVERTGDRKAAENISDQELLREVMNTVGKKDRLGEPIRCVVSVAMLTEGWDANTVTHVLGVRAFGTQLLCEQVIGRALRRQSYDLNEEGLFNVEYADVLGIPFDFTAKPVVAPPQPPRETITSKPFGPTATIARFVSPVSRAIGSNFPRNASPPSLTTIPRSNSPRNSLAHLSPAMKGSSARAWISRSCTRAIFAVRRLLFHLTKRLLEKHWREPDEDPKLTLFGQLKRVAKEWLDNHLVCKGKTYPAQLMYLTLPTWLVSASRAVS